jgi:integrase
MSTLARVPPRATGAIETHEWKDGRTITFRGRVRFRGGRYRIDFGTNHEGWNAARAQVELDEILRQCERGTWEPPEKATATEPPAPPEDETVHVTASRWWQRRRGELAANTQADYRWRLDHLLRELAHETTGSIDARRVDTFRQALVGRGLSARSVNMVLDLLAQVLDDAVDYKLLEANPARGKRRRMKVPRPSRSFLEPDMVVDLLEAAGEWERALPEHQRYGRRALLALLCLSGGPRISEATFADRGELDIHAGRWRIPAAKTDAGARDVELTAYTLDELRSHLATRRPPAQGPLFPTRTGGRLNASNIRNRLLPEAVQRANACRERTGRMLLPGRVTPHTLRRTWAMLALTAGRDARWVMAQMGHTDARLTLQVYAQAIQRQRIDYDLVWKLMRFPDEPERWAGPGSRGAFGPTIGPMTLEPR